MDFISKIITETIDRFIIDETSFVKQKHDRRSHGNYGKKHRFDEPKDNLKEKPSKSKKFSDEEYERISRLIKKIRKNHPELSKREAVHAAIEQFLDQKKKEYVRRTKLKKGGGKETYNKVEYDDKNRKASASDSLQIADRIDQDKTDIAAVAREVFPGHTEQGAQSQLRKILNGERPMTSKVAAKLEDMMASGQVAVKA